MKDKSSLDSFEYILECIIWGVLAMIWYRSLLFRCVRGFTYSQSKVILWLMVIASVVICRFVLFRKNLSYWTLSVALLLPFGIYTLICYRHSIGGAMCVVMTVCGLISFICALVILTCRIRSKRRLSLVIRLKVSRCIYAALSVFSVGMAVIMLPMALHSLFGNNIFSPSVNAQVGAGREPQTIAGNIETVALLEQQSWEKLSTNDKLDVLQTVANIEAYYLGLPNELNVGAANLGQDVYGSYNDDTHSIFIDLEHLESSSAYSVLNSCCHEAYHSFQHRLVEAYTEADQHSKGLRIFRNADKYLREFGSYSDGEEDFYSYYSQACESDARSYAAQAAEDYISKIRDYIENKE